MAIGRIPEPGTGIPESIIAAKGDLIVGTANDTPGILSVGTNGHTLVAKSSEATGLAWEAPAAPTAVGCYVYNNAAISAASGVYTTLTFNSEYFDTDAIHSTSSNTSRLTVPSGLGGKWVVFANLYLYSTAAGYFIAKFQVNGNDKNRLNMYHFGNSNAESIAFSQPFSLSAADYVEVLLYQATGASKNVDTDQYGGFGMMRIGA